MIWRSASIRSVLANFSFTISFNRFLQQHISPYSLAMVDPNSIVAVDCEYVGTGPKGSVSALGRASIVGYNGQIILDIISKPDEPVTDHRTRYSGLTQTLLEDGVPINEALFKVRNEIQGKIVIGHGIFADLKILGISHPTYLVRDTARFVGLVELYNQKVPSSPLAPALQPPLVNQNELSVDSLPRSWYSASTDKSSQLTASAPDLTEPLAASAQAIAEASLSPISVTHQSDRSASSQSAAAASVSSAASSELQAEAEEAIQAAHSKARGNTSRPRGPHTSRPSLYVKRGVSLKRMSLVLLGRAIQQEESGHDSVEDARASLDLYRIVELDFEQAVQRAMPLVRAPPWRY